MPTRPKPSRDGRRPGCRHQYDDTESVTQFLAALEHPLKPVIQSVRAAILSADKRITEGIKWNTAGFYHCGWFATINVRAQTAVQLILHHGAKTRGENVLSQPTSDASDILTWLAKDRAMTAFASAEDFRSKRTAFIKIIKQWAECQGKSEKTA